MAICQFASYGSATSNTMTSGAEASIRCGPSISPCRMALTLPVVTTHPRHCKSVERSSRMSDELSKTSTLSGDSWGRHGAVEDDTAAQFEAVVVMPQQ